MKSKKVNLNLKKTTNDSYSIYINPGILNKIPTYINEMGYKKLRYVIITDSNVKDLYAMPLYKNLNSKGFNGDLIFFNAGEKYKTRKTKQKLEDLMLNKGYGRDTLVIAVGGGVTGDIAGFIAATYSRGVNFIQVPTTILAMVDSSVGGKTGVDTDYGKNLIGAFYQPKAVFIDPETLKTLEQKERVNGIAEIIKHACIKDKSLFYDLIKYKNEILKADTAIMSFIIERNVKIKADVVEQDEKETDLRMILNFGHTIGHAIELLTDYKMGHGECVAIGMAAACEISFILGILPEKDKNEIIECIRKFNLPVTIPEKLDNTKIIETISMDKKAKKGIAKFILLSGIGEVYKKDNSVGITVDNDILIKAVEARKS